MKVSCKNRSLSGGYSAAQDRKLITRVPPLAYFEGEDGRPGEWKAIQGKRMKGTIYCTKCGTANTADANFCFQCGQSITKANGNVDSNEELNQVEEPASIMGQQPPIDTNGPKPIPSRQP